MSNTLIAHEQPPQRRAFAPQPDRHYRRIAKEKDWEGRLAHHQDLGYRLESEMGSHIIVSCDADERRQRQTAAEKESQVRTVARLAASEPGFVKSHDSLELQKVTPAQMEQALALHEDQEVNG